MDNIHPFNLYNSKKFTSFIECIQEIEDPRINRCKHHSLVNIIVIIVFAMLGGANNPTAIERFGKLHVDWFRPILDMPYGIPSHDTLSRALAFIDHYQLSFWLELWREDVFNNGKPRYIAIDGKEDNANGFYCLRAFDCETDRVLAHAKVPKNTNEITIAPNLLNKLDLKDVIISGDAMQTQTKNAKIIINGGGDYVFTVKGNQHQLHDDMKLYLDDIRRQNPREAGYVKYETKDRSRGRIERRICISTNNIGWLYQRKRWKGIRSISAIRSIRTEKGKTTIIDRYFISSLSADPKNILTIVRNHWAIENRCHRQLDIDFEADYSTIRDTYAAMTLAIFSDFVLSLLQNDQSSISIRAKRNRNAFQFESLLKTLLNTGF